jgi:hypothetical protein
VLFISVENRVVVPGSNATLGPCASSKDGLLTVNSVPGVDPSPEETLATTSALPLALNCPDNDTYRVLTPDIFISEYGNLGLSLTPPTEVNVVEVVDPPVT